MLKLRKLSAGFGLEAEGVDLAQPLSEGEFRAVEDAFSQGRCSYSGHSG